MSAPDDLVAKAEAILRKWWPVLPAGSLMYRADIADALNEERERCAKYHDDKAAELEAHWANDDGHFGCAHAVHVFAAYAIRSGYPGK